MKILFVDNFILNFGVSYLSAILKEKGHQVELKTFIFSKSADASIYTHPEKYFDFQEIAKGILGRQPDLVAFSVWSPNFQFYKQLAATLRSLGGPPMLVGGVLPTLRPDLFVPDTACDLLFRGEAEPVIEALVQGLVSGHYQQLPNVVYRGSEGQMIQTPMRSYLDNLDTLPIRDHLLYPNHSHALYVITSRGCAMKCSYCSAGSNSRMVVQDNARLVRKRSVESVITEIKSVLKEGPFREIFFYDDFFINNFKWISEFLAAYRQEIGLPFYCLAFPATVTPAIARELAVSGCQGVLMGFQTANAEYKSRVLSRPEPTARVLRAIECLRAEGVRCSLDHIFNLPGETHEDIRLSLDFYIDNKVDSLMIFFLNYFPDSAITSYALQQGILCQEHYERIMRNEMVGEQSYRGTIIDAAKSDEQVRFAVLFRLIPLLPGKLVKYLFHKKWYRYFPTGRAFYYMISGLAVARGMGLRSLLNTLYLAFGLKGMKPRDMLLKRLKKTGDLVSGSPPGV
ncbi:MAG: radical SAM protein [Magnetococcales bacterium]|nr:radical SAM protein [Magnetococcales bacterium]